MMSHRDAGVPYALVRRELKAFQMTKTRENNKRRTALLTVKWVNDKITGNVFKINLNNFWGQKYQDGILISQSKKPYFAIITIISIS